MGFPPPCHKPWEAPDTQLTTTCEMGWSGQRDMTPCLQPQSHIHPTLDHVGGLAIQGGDTTPEAIHRKAPGKQTWISRGPPFRY